MASSVFIPNGCGIASLVWRLTTGQEVSATIGFDATTGPADFDPNVQAGVIRTIFQQTGAPGNAAQMTTVWNSVGVRVINKNGFGMPQSGESIAPVAGSVTSTSAEVPIYTPLVVSKKTAYAGKKFRGRMYPPFTKSNESLVSIQGVVQPAEVVALQATWTNFFIGMGSSVCKPYLLHTDPAEPRNLITSLTVKSVTGIQRRRRAPGA